MKRNSKSLSALLAMCLSLVVPLFGSSLLGAALPVAAAAEPPAKTGPKSENNPAQYGLVSENPTWSIGLQAGSFSNTGISAQKSGFFQGALNMTLGLGLWSPVFIFDYVRFYTDRFKPYTINDANGVAASRGLLLPFFAIGAQAGRGVGIRASAGAQYTLLEDPVNFFAGVTLMAGPCKCESYLFGSGSFGLGINLGVRVML